MKKTINIFEASRIAGPIDRRNKEGLCEIITKAIDGCNRRISLKDLDERDIIKDSKSKK